MGDEDVDAAGIGGEQARVGGTVEVHVSGRFDPAEKGDALARNDGHVAAHDMPEGTQRVHRDDAGSLRLMQVCEPLEVLVVTAHEQGRRHLLKGKTYRRRQLGWRIEQAEEVGLGWVLRREPPTRAVHPLWRGIGAEIPDLDRGVQPDSTVALQRHQRPERMQHAAVDITDERDPHCRSHHGRLRGSYFGGKRSAPSRRMTTPFR
jgi:hypothetical protein